VEIVLVLDGLVLSGCCNAPQFQADGPISTVGTRGRDMASILLRTRVELDFVSRRDYVMVAWQFNARNVSNGGTVPYGTV